MPEFDISELIQCHFDLADSSRYDWVPDKNITRQDWQISVEMLVAKLRQKFSRPAFGISESDIAIHYHRALSEFSDLMRQRLGLPK